MVGLKLANVKQWIKENKLTVKVAAITFVVSSVIALFGITFVFNPLEEVALASNVEPSQQASLKADCHNGWKDTSISSPSPVYQCTRIDPKTGIEWIVILNPEGTAFERAYKPSVPNDGWETDATKVPGWF